MGPKAHTPSQAVRESERVEMNADYPHKIRMRAKEPLEALASDASSRESARDGARKAAGPIQDRGAGAGGG